jgi:hypothetical protein
MPYVQSVFTLNRYRISEATASQLGDLTLSARRLGLVHYNGGATRDPEFLAQVTGPQVVVNAS